MVTCSMRTSNATEGCLAAEPPLWLCTAEPQHPRSWCAAEDAEEHRTICISSHDLRATDQRKADRHTGLARLRSSHSSAPASSSTAQTIGRVTMTLMLRPSLGARGAGRCRAMGRTAAATMAGEGCAGSGSREALSRGGGSGGGTKGGQLVEGGRSGRTWTCCFGQVLRQFTEAICTVVVRLHDALEALHGMLPCIQGLWSVQAWQ